MSFGETSFGEKSFGETSLHSAIFGKSRSGKSRSGNCRGTTKLQNACPVGGVYLVVSSPLGSLWVVRSIPAKVYIGWEFLSSKPIKNTSFLLSEAQP
jgi:hypothetical protein